MKNLNMESAIYCDSTLCPGNCDICSKPEPDEYSKDNIGNSGKNSG